MKAKSLDIHGEKEDLIDIDEDEIMKIVTEDPSTNVRCVSRRSGVQKSTVHRILKRV